ncbi:hypothetical protein [Salinimicrobium sp. HB62]|uniref:hypothetical protein n=1 Tax=Salinimicrobium sp. HB62 TaxID=3077781 RepID=UPI002D78A7E1|nr:hypothetical protein [Salinimicrobium sp. HB62]
MDLNSPETDTNIVTQQEQELPKLYSKRLILSFSILFSTIFAAALLISNLRRLEKQAAAAWVLLFAVGYIVATAIVMTALNLSPSLNVIANVIGAAILNEFFWNKYLGSEIEYEKKSWIKPTLISVGIALVVFSLLFMGA